MIPSLVKKGAKINYFDPTGKKDDFKRLKNVTYSSNINLLFSLIENNLIGKCI